ncbi:MAG: hypothetical protein J3Q66DRAFT_438761 [Benniella sp.]|nr:MAG: hypothetical protein J3Q66DRAFT_438761 [Benniella sp.]
MLAVAAYLVFVTGALHFWGVDFMGGKITSQDIIDFIIAAMYAIIAFYGVVTTIKDTYRIARSFSISWWVFAVITSLKDAVEIIVAAVREYGLEEKCFRVMPFGCTTQAKWMVPLKLAIHVALMVYFGMAIRRYAQRLDNRHESILDPPTQLNDLKSGKQEEIEKLEDIEEPLELK